MSAFFTVVLEPRPAGCSGWPCLDGVRVIAELTVLSGRPRIIAVLEAGEGALSSVLAGPRQNCRVRVIPARSSEQGLKLARTLLRAAPGGAGFSPREAFRPRS